MSTEDTPIRTPDETVELRDPTCELCLFSQELMRPAAAEGEEDERALFCQYRALQTTGHELSEVNPGRFCADGAWKSADLGLPSDQEPAIGYLVARVNVDVLRRERDRGGIIIARQGLAVPGGQLDS